MAAESGKGANPLAELTKARVREFLREKGVLFWVFAFPVLMAIGLGLAFRSKPPELPRIAVVGKEENTYVRALAGSKAVAAERLDRQSARRQLARAKIDLVVVVDGGNPQYLFDPTQERSTAARLVVDDVLQEAAGRRDPIAIAEQAIAEPGSRYIDFLIPGLIGLNLMGTSMWGVGYNLVVARKRRLLRRYAVTPMRRTHFLLSYFFSRALFLVLEIGILLLFGYFAFGSVVQGSLLLLGLIALLGAASFAGISLLIGARVENTEAANGWMNLVQLPMWVLSGAFFSYERFPGFLHLPIRAMPLTALVDALRAVFNDSSGLLQVMPQMLVLAAWGSIGFVVALKTFRWQ